MTTGPFDGIKAVFFDLDDTLKVSTPTREDTLMTIMGDYGIVIDQGARRAGRRFSYEYWTDSDQVEADMDRLGPDGFWANYIHAQLIAMQVLSTAPDEGMVKEINRRFAEEFRPSSHVAEGTVELLQLLNQRGMIVGLVSNRPLPLHGTAERMGIQDYFDFTLAAGEIGSWKPDPGIFHRALEMSGSVPGERAVYIGDNYYADALGAHRAGLKAILIDPDDSFPEAKEVAFIVPSLVDLIGYLEGSDSGDDEDTYPKASAADALDLASNAAAAEASDSVAQGEPAANSGPVDVIAPTVLAEAATLVGFEPVTSETAPDEPLTPAEPAVTEEDTLPLERAAANPAPSTPEADTQTPADEAAPAESAATPEAPVEPPPAPPAEADADAPAVSESVPPIEDDSPDSPEDDFTFPQG